MIYENGAIYSKKNGLMYRGDYDINDDKFIEDLKQLANRIDEPVYVLREFVANDSAYQEKPPYKLVTDWYALEVKPTKLM